MNRRNFLVRAAQAVAALFVAPAVVAEVALLDAAPVLRGYPELASKFQWTVSYVPLSNAAALPGASHLVQCYGKFQDGKEYQCAEYLNFEGEYVGGVFEETNPELILEELAVTFDQAMRRRFVQIENDSDWAERAHV